MKHLKQFAAVLACSLVLAGCGQEAPGGTTAPAATAGAVYTAPDDITDQFSDRDYEIGYDEDECTRIQLNGDSAQCSAKTVTVSGGTVTITGEGTYLLSGALDNGMIIVDAGDSEKLQLILDGVSIRSASSAAIYVREADKVFITTAQDSVNTLSNGGEYAAIDENNIDAVIFSKADLTLNGGGTLILNGEAGHGVVSKDDLVVTSGVYQITAASHGLSGKDSVRIAGGSFTITAGKDGIHAENDDDASLGYLYISDGSFAVTAEGDGLSAGNYLRADGGSFTITAGGGSANASTTQSGNAFGRFPNAFAPTAEDTTSTKGIKAAGDLTIYGGSYTIDSADDGMHSNTDLAVYGGSFQIATGDDGFHADANLTVSSGNILITQSYEGLEGETVDITGGEIRLTATDDGVNASGGNDQSGFGGFGGRGMDSFASSGNVYIHISGGTLYVNASGDGIDSNGSIAISGGTTYVSGPSNSGNASLDYGSDAVITGGTFVAAGASSQMAQNFSTSSTQGAMMVTVSSQQAGSTVRLTDSSGKELISWVPEQAYNSLIISCPELSQGAAYTLTAGDAQTAITMQSLIYGSGMGTGGFGGGPGKDNFGGGQQPGRR